MSWLMYTVLKKNFRKNCLFLHMILKKYSSRKLSSVKRKNSVDTKQKRTRFMLKVLGFVFLMRCLLFVASFLSIPIEIVAVLGSLVLLIWRWYYLRTNPVDILKKTPWHILIFAFSMYVIIYGLHNAGLTAALVQWLEPVVNQHLLYASFTMGGLVSLLSNVFNNHPALMIGTITLTEMGLDPITLKRFTSQTLLVVTSVHYYYQSVR